MRKLFSKPSVADTTELATTPASLAGEKKVRTIANLTLVVALAIFSFSYVNVNPLAIFTSMPTLLGFLGNNFFPPNTNNLPIFLRATFDTLLFAIIGTYISAILAFVFGVLMAESLVPNPIVRGVVRLISAFFRNIPVIIWVSLLVFIFGIGNMVGLIALVIVSIGFLARSYGESINEIAGTKLEAMKASGASWCQLVFHGLMPEFAPAWINWTLFSFEINIRASAILGMVGAGGLGILIQTNLNLRNFTATGTLMIILVSLVLATEFCVNLIRKQLAR